MRLFTNQWISILKIENSISTLEIDIVRGEQGYFEYDVDNEQWPFMRKLFQN